MHKNINFIIGVIFVILTFILFIKTNALILIAVLILEIIRLINIYMKYQNDIDNNKKMKCKI